MSEQLAEMIGQLYERVQASIAQELFEEAESLLQSLLPLLEQAGDRIGQARVLEQLGSVYEQCGRLTEARRSYEAGLRVTHPEARDLECLLLHRLGHLSRPSNPVQARGFFARSAGLADTLGDRRGAALSRAMIGQIEFTAGEQATGMIRMLAALVEMPADAPERTQLVEHAAYLSERMPSGSFQHLVQDHVPAGELALALLTARARRPKLRNFSELANESES